MCAFRIYIYSLIYFSVFVPIHVARREPERSFNRSSFLLLLDLSIRCTHINAPQLHSSRVHTHASPIVHVLVDIFEKHEAGYIHTGRQPASQHTACILCPVSSSFFVLLPWTSLFDFERNSSGRASNILAWQPYSLTIPWNCVDPHHPMEIIF